jgi:hypothetical protein
MRGKGHRSYPVRGMRGCFAVGSVCRGSSTVVLAASQFLISNLSNNKNASITTKKLLAKRYDSEYIFITFSNKILSPQVLVIS